MGIRTFNPLIQSVGYSCVFRAQTAPIASTGASTSLPKKASMASAASLDVGVTWL